VQRSRLSRRSFAAEAEISFPFFPNGRGLRRLPRLFFSGIFCSDSPADIEEMLPAVVVDGAEEIRTKLPEALLLRVVPGQEDCHPERSVMSECFPQLANRTGVPGDLGFGLLGWLGTRGICSCCTIRGADSSTRVAR